MIASLSPDTAYKILLLCCLPVCLWVTMTDLRSMKIPNTAVYTLLGIFAVVGLAVIPLEVWLWRWVGGLVVFAIGFAIYSLTRGFGAGDLKFAAAAAPFVSQNMHEVQIVLLLLAFYMLATLALHRLAGMVPAIRRATPDWASWTRKAHVPVGVALAATLATYLALKAFPSFYGWAAGLFA
jgi:prepilin peptidase CpaA